MRILELKLFRNIDLKLLFIILPLLLIGLLTMKSFGGGSDYYFWRQLVWILASLAIFFIFSKLDWRVFKSSGLILSLYMFGVASLVFIFVVADASWFYLPLFAIQPAEPMKLLLVLILAKYFSRRHVDIAQFKHIAVSAVYAVIPAGLIFFQPDLGSAIIFGVIWIGMIMASGVSKKHLAILFTIGLAVLAISWIFFLKPYQKTRINTFLNPYIDPQGAGYNAMQSKIAVGSGGFLGQGIGHGTQSRLEFLPEHETDFIFAAFAEEWGFVGSLILILFFILLVRRLLLLGTKSSDNFVRLYAIGISLIIIGHFTIHVGMNIGLLPITGLPLSFVSYGGSHLATLFAALGIWSGMKFSSRTPEAEEVYVS